MIARDGERFVHLGGLLGDRVTLFEPGAAPRVVADLGQGDCAPVTPQRRLLLRGDHLFVLEPASGPELKPPLRVRRLDLGGRELDRVEGEGAPGEGDLFFRADRDGPGHYRLSRLGIDPATGGPVRHEESLALDRGGGPFTGTPVRGAGAWWYPLRMKGLLRVEGDRTEVSPGEPAAVCLVRGQVACVGVAGLWLDGVWEPHSEWGRIFPPWRPPLGDTVAPWGDGLAILRPEGGELPVRNAPPPDPPQRRLHRPRPQHRTPCGAGYRLSGAQLRLGAGVVITRCGIGIRTRRQEFFRRPRTPSL